MVLIQSFQIPGFAKFRKTIEPFTGLGVEKAIGKSLGFIKRET